ncbi:MAG: 4Fe-4S dicluster domain-containing protein [Nitrososphaerota archaeon]|nr:4Fe-4S dicluster domain-containing protein [Nitrososphaerota archaeon]
MVETSVAQVSLEKQLIKGSEIDSTFKYELVKLSGSERILSCFQCGTCTSDCPVARYNGSYQPRTLIRMAILGLKECVLKSDTLWLCAACFVCTDRCPQDIEVASVIRVFRNLAVENNCLPQVFRDQLEAVLETGYAYRISELRMKKRELQNLPPLPKGNAENIYKILKGIKIVEETQKIKGDRTHVKHQ